MPSFFLNQVVWIGIKWVDLSNLSKINKIESYPACEWGKWRQSLWWSSSTSTLGWVNFTTCTQEVNAWPSLVGTSSTESQTFRHPFSYRATNKESSYTFWCNPGEENKIVTPRALAELSPARAQTRRYVPKAPPVHTRRLQQQSGKKAIYRSY